MRTGKRLILVRHASTKPLETGKISTRDYDECLSEEGQRHRLALAARLSKIHVDAVYSSPQPRALATTRIISKRVEVAASLEDWRDGEGHQQMYGRVTEFVDSLRDGTFVIVSHGTPIAMILCHYTHASMYHQACFGITPASISVIQNGVVVAVNDTAHLDLWPETENYDPRTWTYGMMAGWKCSL